MRSIKIFFLFLITLNTFSQTTVDTLFFDGFKDNAVGWPQPNDASNKTEIRNGVMYWENVSGGYSTWYNYSSCSFDIKQDFIVEAKFKIIKPGEHGLIWGLKDLSNANYFTIKDGQYHITQWVNGQEKVSAAFTKSPKIRPDFNTLKVWKKEDKLQYFVNDDKVFEESFTGVLGYGFGVNINTCAVEIDYLLLKNILIPANLKYEKAPENLGLGVNSEYSEIQPLISPDGRSMYYVRCNHPGNYWGKDDNRDVWYSYTDNNGKWATSSNIGYPINNKSSSGTVAVTPDGNTLVLINQYNSDGEIVDDGFSMTHRTKKGWAIPENINIKKYYNRADYVEACMSSDQQTMIFAIQRDDTHGERDLYFSKRIGENKWTEPKNLGSVVNTSCGEMSPYIAPDGITLYFSSNGHPGYGSNDIFFTRRLDDSWTNWSTPLNMGKPVNTTDWDAYYSVPASGEYAYMVSSNTSSYGASDVFKVKLPKAVKPVPVVLISGKVLNSKTKEPIPSAKIVYSVLSTNKEVGIASPNPNDGSYKIVLPAGESYSFLAAAKGFISVNENMDLKELQEYKEITKDLYLVPLEVGEVVRLNNIFFDFGKATLRPESYPELDRVVKIMNDNSSMQIEMSGHTDNVGSDEANLKLSDDRAKAVKDYLVSKGIAEARVLAKGYGETKPVATNDTDEGRQFNRRVEFTILKK